MMIEFKLMFGFVGAGLCWIADIAANASNVMPAWLSEYGLPGIFLGLTIYAVRTLFAANQQMQRDALAAKDAQISANDANAKLFLSTTKELIDATNHQTTQLEKLTTELHARPCQAPK